MISSSDVFTSIAQDLSRSKEAKRAKKLVFYVSQRYWESDFSVINGYAWEDMLQSLYQNNPTIDDLKALLYHAVNTLNRKNVYVKIAKYILKRMSSLYESNSGRNSNTDSDVEQSDNEVLDTIVYNLQSHEESPRMKKLIFAACKQYWENDINVIEMYDLKDLILELQKLYPHTKKLRKALDNVVATINRQNFYSFIADSIIAEVSYLYKYEANPNNASNSGDEDEETMLILANQNKTKDNQSEQEIIDKPKETQVSEEESIQASTSTSMTTPEEQIIPWLKVDNLYDLKQEIMQYTNPLRAKIMLFYAIYQIDPNEQHWSVVRTCSLDDLLLRMFQNYGENIEKIESHLKEIAKCSMQGMTYEDNLQAVSAIVEAVKRFYKKR